MTGEVTAVNGNMRLLAEVELNLMVKCYDTERDINIIVGFINGILIEITE